MIYIAGMSHSGSTVLNLMLNAHPEMVSVGELIDLTRRTRKNASERTKKKGCACGAPSLWECEFWLRVNAHTLRIMGKSLAELDVLNDRTLDERCAANAVVFDAVAEVAGKRYVVDSSKRPGRLSYLKQLKGLDLYPIHLIRNPNGQVASLCRKNGGFLKHVYSYVRIHGQIRKLLRSVPHSVVHYEELVLNPAATLSRVLGPIGLEFDERQLLWAEQVQHTLGGNNLRWQSRGLCIDERWRQSLSSIQQLTINLGTAYTRHCLGAPGD